MESCLWSPNAAFTDSMHFPARTKQFNVNGTADPRHSTACACYFFNPWEAPTQTRSAVPQHMYCMRMLLFQSVRSTHSYKKCRSTTHVLHAHATFSMRTKHPLTEEVPIHNICIACAYCMHMLLFQSVWSTHWEKKCRSTTYAFHAHATFSIRTKHPLIEEVPLHNICLACACYFFHPYAHAIFSIR